MVFKEDGTPKIVFELKWWMSSRKKNLNLLEADIKKLRAWPTSGNAQRILITFWHSPEGDWESDKKEVDTANASNWLDVQIMGYTRFPIHYFNDQPHYFAVAALDVSNDTDNADR